MHTATTVKYLWWWSDELLSWQRGTLNSSISQNFKTDGYVNVANNNNNSHTQIHFVNIFLFARVEKRHIGIFHDEWRTKHKKKFSKMPKNEKIFEITDEKWNLKKVERIKCYWTNSFITGFFFGGCLTVENIQPVSGLVCFWDE